MTDEATLKKNLEERITSLRQERLSYWNHWRELADFILPRRYRSLVTTNDMRRGAPLSNRIIDSTATIAARNCASGMMSGITSPTRPWFKLSLVIEDPDEASPTNQWLAECQKRMLRVFAESNFYQAMATQYLDLVVFGTSLVLVYEDFDDVIRCYTPALGEYFLSCDDRLAVDAVYREMTMTVDQMVKKFGKEKLSDSLKALAERPSNAAREILVGHAIEPNDGTFAGVAKRFKYRDVYWELGKGGATGVLSARGFNEFIALAPRWDLTSNDVYGRSPAMDALGDVKQLQQETKRKAQAIDKLVNPPLIADAQLKNQPSSLLPGAVNYVQGMNNVGMKPIYTVTPPVQEMMMDIKEIQIRIKEIFFNDLFMMFQNMAAEPRSAAAIDARREEKLIMLGPVIERFQNESLDPAIDRVFSIMTRGKLLPPPPDGAQGAHIKVEYVSMLAEAQRATGTAGIERWLAQLGSVFATKQDIMDVVDTDEMVREYGALLSVPPKLMKSQKAVDSMRAERAKQMQGQQAINQTNDLAKAGKTMSETDVGGGINALAAMTGGAPP